MAKFRLPLHTDFEDGYVGYYKELLSNKAVIQKVHSERNKHLGLTLEEFKRAVEEYFLYRLESRHSSLVYDVSIAAKLAMEHYQTNSPEAKKYTKNFVKLQNAQYLHASADSDHSFRSNPITHFGLIRSPISVLSDHF